MVNKRELESHGYALARTWGGPQKIKYYRPDGGEVWKIPGYLEDGKGVKYDILILKGYTFTPPEHPKPHCNGCTNWHDTQEEVDVCVKAHKKSEADWDSKARKLYAKEVKPDESVKVAKLEKQIEDLTKLVEKLVETGKKAKRKRDN